ILSNYPGRSHQIAHAVGLDALASTETLLGDLRDVGFDVEGGTALARALSEDRLTWSVAEYRAALAELPASLREHLEKAWGAAEIDQQVQEGAFHFAALRRGKALIAVQPDRGEVSNRVADYHDLSRAPRHAYVAFYLWLRHQGIDAVIQMGAH